MNLFKKRYPKVVEDIHNEFFTAGDKILEEAKAILKELDKQGFDKGKRLSALGFNRTKEAVSAVQNEVKMKVNAKLAELVQYYNRYYPNNKFITEEQVKTICEKYGLIFGDTTMYKGFVPENKLAIIENFKLRKEDSKAMWFEVTENHNGVVTLPLSVITEDDLTDFGKEYMSTRSYSYIAGSDGRLDFDVYKEETANLFKGLKFVKAQAVEKNLRICAPLKDMQIPLGKQVVGHKIQDIPDPVVLQPVRGGYLIVCAWGDEASDEIVVNQTMN